MPPAMPSSASSLLGRLDAFWFPAALSRNSCWPFMLESFWPISPNAVMWLCIVSRQKSYSWWMSSAVSTRRVALRWHMPSLLNSPCRYLMSRFRSALSRSLHAARCRSATSPVHRSAAAASGKLRVWNLNPTPSNSGTRTLLPSSSLIAPSKLMGFEGTTPADVSASSRSMSIPNCRRHLISASMSANSLAAKRSQAAFASSDGAGRASPMAPALRWCAGTSTAVNEPSLFKESTSSGIALGSSRPRRSRLSAKSGSLLRVSPHACCARSASGRNHSRISSPVGPSIRNEFADLSVMEIEVLASGGASTWIRAGSFTSSATSG
mmetsp:Transcript_22535/g.67610  ORF Transcript_22535/g.67610 Transcript_22535/m.67610 type:complete len:323 (+) Transcript_22535:193-1161(+)